MSLTKIVTIENNHPITTSTKVADAFHKRHDNVIQKLQSLDCSEKFNALNFKVVEYLDKKGESRKSYTMTKDGFMFLVMGFTGKKAASIKEAFIAKFNEMEAKLLKKQQTHPKLTPQLQHQLKSTIDAKLSVFSSEDQKRLYPQVWARVKNKFKVTQYADIREDEIGDVINYLLHMELEMPKKFKGFEVLPQRIYIEDGEVRALTNDDRVVSASEVFDIRVEITNAIGMLQNARDTITKTFELNKLISQAS